MSKVESVLKALNRSEEKFNELMLADEVQEFETQEIYGADLTSAKNIIAECDNLNYMLYMLKQKQMGGKIQLIYIDPPFFTNGKYQSSLQLKSDTLGKSPVIRVGGYDDTWGNDMEAYLFMLALRLRVMRELLSDTGCIWVHLDWHGSHYVKVMMDEIFGENNFVNEIAWNYKSGGASKRSFAKKHDTLLFYSKTKKYKFNILKEKSYNRGYKPYRFKGVEEFCDDIGWYTMVNMKDVWDIDMVGRTSSERTGYATQKPEKLLARIIEACTDEGDMCADFFAGSGTLGAAADKMNRSWIMCDEGDVAISGQIGRMLEREANFQVVRASAKAAEENAQGISIEATTDSGFVRILEYNIDLSQAGEGVEMLGEFLREDSTSIISNWSVDDNYDGHIHRAEHAIKKGDVHLITGEPGRISILGYDMLGNRFHKVI